MLTITDLHARVDDKEIIKGLTLSVKPGEVAAIMGPNGAGKSTLSYVCARQGREGYDVTGGDVTLGGDSLLGLEANERAAKGVFLAFQYPLEIPGVTKMCFLAAALDSRSATTAGRELSTPDFLSACAPRLPSSGVSREMLNRAAQRRFLRRREEAHGNPADGRAGAEAEHARRDRFRASTSTPLRIVADGVNRLRRPTAACSSSPTTSGCWATSCPDACTCSRRPHRQESGGKELALELEKKATPSSQGKAA